MRLREKIDGAFFRALERTHKRTGKSTVKGANAE